MKDIMKLAPKLDSRIWIGLRWIGRIAGSLLALLALVGGVDVAIYGDPKGMDIPLPDLVADLAFLGVWVVGVVLAWKWEAVGGGILVSGWIVHSVLRRSALWPCDPLLVFAIIGILFLVCGMKSRRRRIRGRSMSSSNPYYRFLCRVLFMARSNPG